MRTEEEVKSVMRVLKKEKAVELDGVYVKAWKLLGDISIKKFKIFLIKLNEKEFYCTDI